MNMNREQAKEFILSHSTDYLRKDKSGKGYVCPICGSGNGQNGTGITTKDGRHFTCWAGCFSNSDIIDIIGLENGIAADDYNEKLYKAASAFRITIDASAGEYQKQDKNEQHTHTQMSIHNTAYTYTHTHTQQEETEQDYTDFFLKAHKDIDKTEYHRGLSPETLEHFNVGYVENWKHPKAPKSKPSPRLIIPTSEHSYLARHASKEDYINYLGKPENKSKVGKVRLFNTQVLLEAETPIYVVEGEIDAMSIYEVGGYAIGLGSMGNAKKLIKLLEEMPIEERPKQPFVIALDNEADSKKQGEVEKNVQTLEEGFKRLGIHYYKKNITGSYKDANEALNAGEEDFCFTIYKTNTEVVDSEEEALNAEKDRVLKESAAYALPNFLQAIVKSKNAAAIPTGFPELDALLDGGLYAGLYFVGAISSLGKTTFCLQIADQIAQSGRDVLVFSLEMARNELIAKSVSRLTLLQDLAQYKTTVHAKTTRGILAGAKYAYYNQTESEIIQAAINAYGQYAKHIYIIEGMGNVGVDKVRDKVEEHIKATGNAPVVIIDYLQILSPVDMRATDKQNTDKAVLELKLLSRDYEIPVVGISSFNRENYTAPVNMAAYKESGAVEYSSDILIGLQYYGMDYVDGEKDKDRDTRIRKLIKEMDKAGKSGNAQRVQVKILKHRNGTRGDFNLDFYPMFNYFKSIQGEKKEEGSVDINGWTTVASTFE